MSGTGVSQMRIRVAGDPGGSLRKGLLATVEQLMPLKFVGDELAAGGPMEADGLISESATSSARSRMDGTPSLAVASALEAKRANSAARIEIRFSDDEAVPFPFRGRMVWTDSEFSDCSITVEPGERVLASGPSGPIWTLAVVAGTQHFRSALPLLNIEPGMGFNDVFGGDRFVANLPLMHFLRTLPSARVEEAAPLRAAFIFDDPNLHWPSYGFINFLDTAKRAIKENYHVSFATIPLDSWFSHQGAAEIFRQYPQALSLLIHGNNHARHELAMVRDESERAGLLRQAVLRIEKLERKTGLPVCRVMVPPHGACSEEMLQTLTACGFESACISSGSLKAHNAGRPWTTQLGFHPSENVAGCSVLPRWSLAGNVENTLLTAAYLGRPMIFRGHHQDLKDGLEKLDAIAGLINGLGPVKWLRLSELSRTSYRFSMESRRCIVTPFGTRTHFNIPPSSTELQIEAGPGVSASAAQTVLLNGSARQLAVGEVLSLTDTPDRSVEIHRLTPSAAAHAKASFPRTSAGLVLRRLLTESRDRFVHPLTG